MSRLGWQDEGSAHGRVQRLATAAGEVAEAARQEAYRAWYGHDCYELGCETPGRGCEARTRLWLAYLETRPGAG